ncbi:hypothetical protein L596_026282 [Steinernema carpocapsae]|uniref:Uncharacterized protein n=1 Tax=Steinernema carpocapsae TaxID=34508 RepID=A0A4U5M0X8_STECR|nr:hypothetical protein L596_026282 [Steinernema carpocapsae]
MVMEHKPDDYQYFTSSTSGIGSMVHSSVSGKDQQQRAAMFQKARDQHIHVVTTPNYTMLNGFLVVRFFASSWSQVSWRNRRSIALRVFLGVVLSAAAMLQCAWATCRRWRWPIFQRRTISFLLLCR